MRPDVAGRPLSHREWLAVCCWVNGMQLHQVAYSLGISTHSAKTYLARAARKRGTYVPRVLIDPGPPPHQQATTDA